ncbi:MAG TPA: hypothetical protein VF511_06325 [Chthoniobacterales bacterium]|jgi:hypothetical protein
MPEKKTAPKKKAAPMKDLPKIPADQQKVIKGGAKRRLGDSSE